VNLIGDLEEFVHAPGCRAGPPARGVAEL